MFTLRTILISLLMIICNQITYGQELTYSREIRYEQAPAMIMAAKPAPVGYPILGERPFPLLTERDKQITQDALAMAHEMTNNCRCDQALREFGIESLAALLKLEININLYDGRGSTLALPRLDETGIRETVGRHFNRHKEQIVAEVIPETITGKGKIIFLNVYFFNPSIDATMAQYQRAIILLHESVHQFGHKSDYDFGGSLLLTARIIKACLPNTSMQKHMGAIFNKR